LFACEFLFQTEGDREAAKSQRKTRRIQAGDQTEFLLRAIAFALKWGCGRSWCR
jgi:hypothetical protein